VKLQLFVIAMLVLALPACAQTTNNWQKVYAPPPPAKAPANPYAPPPSPAFKPYQGNSTYSNRGGINAYPAAPKPKSGATPGLFGPNAKPRY